MKFIAFEVMAVLLCGVGITLFLFLAGAIYSAVVSFTRSMLKGKEDE